MLAYLFFCGLPCRKTTRNGGFQEDNDHTPLYKNLLVTMRIARMVGYTADLSACIAIVVGRVKPSFNSSTKTKEKKGVVVTNSKDRWKVENARARKTKEKVAKERKDVISASKTK